MSIQFPTLSSHHLALGIFRYWSYIDLRVCQPKLLSSGFLLNSTYLYKLRVSATMALWRICLEFILLDGWQMGSKCSKTGPLTSFCLSKHYLHMPEVCLLCFSPIQVYFCALYHIGSLLNLAFQWILLNALKSPFLIFVPSLKDTEKMKLKYYLHIC